jgi:hypothetical protein
MGAAVTPAQTKALTDLSAASLRLDEALAELEEALVALLVAMQACAMVNDPSI